MVQENQDLLFNIGQAIKAERLNKGYSQEKLALEANLDRTYISAIERGKKNLTVTSLDKIACVLKVKMSDLLKDLGDENA
ncbi:helix-turn-helix transcriptional regulator [Acinetobacter baumannii]|uniref:helix-turn-helix domain-containing protein n=1 Tax=Acinetobacter baumannii TaxID=470 RepID=UPI000A38C426|nr:helix-turn-helix transcriptional regulator [Acinetobacter baumannii]EKT9378613.1 helix-turn-helix transcriptional regulator [Acinetobacter baumannii]EKU0757455.1 helix-turn-helix transcriptional regulator [Acinetobacter baumannii]EKV8391542.1 helix-turn-helix transcriptional regulator [Acinetobacter baumannii]EKW0728047.1 helix-turn-helix transcriptional regulator [Acinetobacter baumannii]EKW0736911.1 helix-turn-helix transcriptional regulator [Acinetobacter baumannii]